MRSSRAWLPNSNADELRATARVATWVAASAVDTARGSCRSRSLGASSAGLLGLASGTISISPRPLTGRGRVLLDRAGVLAASLHVVSVIEVVLVALLLLFAIGVEIAIDLLAAIQLLLIEGLV